MNIKFILYYLPFLLALAVKNSFELSFTIAWLGCIFTLLLSISKFMTNSSNILSKPMRPIIITNIIFSTYMGISSIFYFLDLNGYYFLTKNEFYITDIKQIEQAVEAQLVYCLAQAAYATGLSIGFKGNIYSPVKIVSENMSKLTIKFTFILFILGYLCNIIPGLSQFAALFSQLSLVTSTYCLTMAIIERNTVIILIAGALFGANEVNALLSGWKESVIVPFILLGTNLFPYYKKTILIVMPIFIISFFYLIPTYNEAIRMNAWSGETSSEEAQKIALEKLKNRDTEEMDKTNWAFLTGRISEIGMLVKFVEEVPKNIDYYGLQLVWQGFENIVPRIFYPNKPITESLVMERVVKIGIVSELAVVSAKPQTVADAYISGGYLFVFVFFIVFGLHISWCCKKAEYLFGGYEFGSAVIFTGLFQAFWRGNCFEFLIANSFWAIFLMYVLHKIGKKLGVIQNKIN